MFNYGTGNEFVDNLPVTLKFAVIVGGNGLFLKIAFILFLLAFLIFLAVKVNTEYSWQKNTLYLSILFVGFGYIAQLPMFFKLGLLTYVVVFILGTWKWVKTTYIDIQLQKVQDIKFKNLSKYYSVKGKEYNSIMEAMSENWKIGIAMLLAYIEEYFKQLMPLLTLLLIFTVVLVILILYILFFYYIGTQYFMK